MIGVIAESEDFDLVREFFELFKTPWEFYRTERKYDVVLCAQDDAFTHRVSASLVVVYSSQKTTFDEYEAFAPTSHQCHRMVSYAGSLFPIYGKSVTLEGQGGSVLKEYGTNQSIGIVHESRGEVIARFGYDLFDEIRLLLNQGQPPEKAGIPTLEMHIALLRDLIAVAGIPLVEIPPIPPGYAFIACLTHDVDHPSIRRHKWDHTAFGFLYRAVIGSTLKVLSGSITVRHLFLNWMAAAKLPFIYLGLAEDIWDRFDKYVKLEKDAESTFFVLPFENKPGRTTSGCAPEIRASGYGAADIAERLQGLATAGREIGLHGIDAWIDTAEGRKEMAQIQSVVGMKPVGVRMHWLYFNENSPATLERAGFTYDSTIGYNETIGYRTGTTQVYKPLGAQSLLELPLHVMDTALFYPAYLNLSFSDANTRIGTMINYAIRFGGVITFNWHDRSIAPERLWGDFYRATIDRLQKAGAWCTGAGSVISWFQSRRSVVFVTEGQGLDSSQVEIVYGGLSGLKVRIYNGRRDGEHSSSLYDDLTIAGNTRISLGRRSPAVNN